MQPTGPEEEVARERAHDRAPHPRAEDSVVERQDVIRHETVHLPDSDPPRKQRGWRFWRRG
jgi:hypothetical protein